MALQRPTSLLARLLLLLACALAAFAAVAVSAQDTTTENAAPALKNVALNQVVVTVADGTEPGASTTRHAYVPIENLPLQNLPLERPPLHHL